MAAKSKLKRPAKKAVAHLRAPCIEIKQGQLKFYVTKFTAKQLSTVVAIARRDRGTGYQRHFSPGRIKAIAKFYDERKAIPAAVLISFDDAEIRNGEIVVPVKANSGWVIDGQHRYLGALAANLQVELPVIAFIKLPVTDQIDQFITINREARGVPSSLYIELLKNLPRSKSADELAQERVADISHYLNDNEQSILHGRIVIMTVPRKGEISLTNFARKAKAFFVRGRGILASYPLDTQQKIMLNYFNAIAHAFHDEFERDLPILFQTIGFGAFLNVFPTVFQSVFSATKGGFELKDVIRFLEAIGELPFDSWRELGTGNAAEMAAARDLEAAILSAHKQTADGTSIRV